MPSRIFASVMWGLAIVCLPAGVCAKAPTKSSLSGKIENPAGGLSVKLKPVEKNPLSLYDGYSAQVAADGSFHIDDIEPGRYVLVAEGPTFMATEYGATKLGKGGTPIGFKPRQHRKGVAITLMPKHVVCGRVTDEQGRPVPNAWIAAYAHHEGSNWLTSDDLKNMQTNTDDAGNYRLPNLPPGEYFVRAGGYAWFFGSKNLRQNESEIFSNAEPVEVGPDNSTACRENIRTGPRVGWHSLHIRGKIDDDPALTGHDLVLSLLEVNPTGAVVDAMAPGTGLTNSPGDSFDLWGLRPGRYRLVLSKGRFPPSGSPSQPAFYVLSSQELAVTDADIDGIAVGVDPHASLTGQMKLDGITSGVACPTRAKTHLSIQRDGDGQFQQVELNAEGNFSFPQIAPGTYNVRLYPFQRGSIYVKSVLLDGLRIEGRKIKISSAAPHTLTVVLGGNLAEASGHIAPDELRERYQTEGTHPTASVSGKVTNALPEAPWVKLWSVRFNSARSYEYATKPAPDGSFRFDNVDPGIYVLITQGPGYALTEYGAPYPGLEGTSITLNAGQNLEGLSLIASPKAPGICGKITDVDGRPIQNVNVVAWRQFSEGGVQYLPDVKTDSNGNFRFLSLQKGKYFLGTDLIALAPDGQVLALQRAYYPSSPNLDGAQPIEVGIAPDTQCGHDIQMRTSPEFHIRGKLVGPIPDALGDHFDVMLVETNPGGAEGWRQYRASVVPSRAFEFANVRPGHYRIVVTGHHGEEPMLFSGPCSPPRRVVASREVVVGDGDLNDVTIEPDPPLLVTGEIQFEDIPKEWLSFRVDSQTVIFTRGRLMPSGSPT